MKWIFTLCAALTLLLSFTTTSTHRTANTVYDELARQLEKQIEAYAFFDSGGDKRVTNAEILMNGDIILYYGSDETIMFNLYNLVKTYKMIFGIELTGNKAIRFIFPGNESVLLTFPGDGQASKVYESFLALMKAGKDQYEPDLPLDINETVDSINNLLGRLSSYGSNLNVNIAGTVILTNSNRQFFSFNLADLVSSDYNEGFEVNGIEMIPCTYEKVAVNNWINFNTSKGNVAYIKFDGVSDEQLNKLHQLLIHLRSSMMNIMYS